MRKLNALAIMALSLFAFSCSGDRIETLEPQVPIIESASLKGLSGESSVEAGAAVKFTASVRVEGSSLKGYSVLVSRAGETIASAEGPLEGESAVIEEDIVLDADPAGLTEDFIPEVILKVTNTDGMFTERTLTEQELLTVKAPEVFEQLYLVDSNGKVFIMKPSRAIGKYCTEGSLDGIGISFTVASSLTGDGRPDGKVWPDMPVPDSGGYGLVWLGFNAITGEVSKMIDHTEVFDYSEMAQDAADGYKVYWARTLVQDCRCEFINFPSGLHLQGDRFDDVDGNVARYTGHTCSSFEVYHVGSTNWLIVKYQWNVADALWLTGDNSSLPMSPWCEGIQLDWFVNSPNGICATSTISFVKADSDSWRALAYLKANFSFKIYSGWGWNYEVSPVKSMSPELLTITPIEADEAGNLDGNFANPGPGFKEGLYMIYFNSLTSEVSLARYTGASLPVIGI